MAERERKKEKNKTLRKRMKEGEITQRVGRKRKLDIEKKEWR